MRSSSRRRPAACGAEVMEGWRARDVEFLDGGRRARVQAVHGDGRAESWEAAYFIDASGRDTFLGARLRMKRRNKKHNSAAMYAHFTGACRERGKRAGNISIYWFDHGWFWFIPLADGTTSVGAVVWPYYMQSRAIGLHEFFLSTIALCPPLAERLSAAELCREVEATGNYSYVCDHSHAGNYLLVGDAYAFIDPVFSSGVMLAMNSGAAAAETIDSCRRDPAGATRALKRFDRLMRHGPRQFSWFIYRVTNPTMRELFLGPRNVLRMQEALLSLLATVEFWPYADLGLLAGIQEFVLRALRRESGPVDSRSARPARQQLQRLMTGALTFEPRGGAPLVCALVAAAGFCTPLRAAEQPLWEVGLGIGVLGYDNYRGADTSHVYPVPVPYVAYNGPILKADQEGVRGFLFDRRWVEVNLSGDFTMPVSNDRTRSGMPQLKPTVEAGVMVDFHLWRSEDSRIKLDLRVPVRPGLPPCKCRRSRSVDADAGLRLRVKDPCGFAGWNAGIYTGPLFGNRHYDGYFYTDPLKMRPLAAGIPGRGRLHGDTARSRLDEAPSSLLGRCVRALRHPGGCGI